jgi:ribonucleoside-diphosphate reductase alpha chain
MLNTTKKTAAAAFARRWVPEGVNPYDLVAWERRDVKIVRPDGSVVFEQEGVEVPAFWSQNATQILAQKYFRGNPGTPERETSLRQVIDRVVNAIRAEAVAKGYLDDEEAEAFSDELTWLLLHQRTAFNSPVWFNVGVPGRPPQVAACFILDVEDDMDSILDWYRVEGKIFKGGSGAGVNLSKIRSSKERLSTGGTASGPVSFMRGADASAGTIKSGGATRRAAKMVVLDVDHPDIRDFVWCKAREERKIRVLRDAGFDMGVDGADVYSVQYQNANNSVRVSDEFMEAVVEDREWALVARTDGSVVETVRAKELFREIAQAAWECADPGIQFDTTINRWNTTPNAGRIRASNPCSEHVRLDWSSCNLSSLNLLAFRQEDGGFDWEGFSHAAGVMGLAQEVLISLGAYPDPRIKATTRRFRDIGVGYANLGALLMSMGMPYDSDEGRRMAAAITSVMTASVYRTSALVASRVGPFDGFEADREGVLRVLRMHQEANEALDEAAEHAQEIWQEAIDLAETYGVRNAEATVVAPTGTISLLMDCQTTGIEPAFSLVAYKTLVGGGTMRLSVPAVADGLRTLGYGEAAVERISAYVAEHGTLAGAPGFDEAHAPVFATAVGDHPISPMGHVAMMAAVQPFISGAISKTVNLPAETTVEEVERVYLDAWRMGVKCLAVYRDGCKAAQPLATKVKDAAKGATTEASSSSAEPVGHPHPLRERLPRTRNAKTFAFQVADCEGYFIVGEYPDGRPGELFMKVSKQGSTLAGIMDALAIAVSVGLQHGVPLETYVAKYTGTRFEPAGMTDDPDVRIASSLLDFVFRKLALVYLEPEVRQGYGIVDMAERKAMVGSYAQESAVQVPLVSPGLNGKASYGDAPFCPTCGNRMTVRTGTCWACAADGTTSGCS